MKRILTLILSIFTLITITSCNFESPDFKPSFDSGTQEDFWGNSTDTKPTPDISFTDPDSVEKPGEGGEINPDPENPVPDKPLALTSADELMDIYYSVGYDLDNAGFKSTIGGALLCDNNNKDIVTGILYYYPDFTIYSLENYYSAGFFEVLKGDQPRQLNKSNDELILIKDLTDYSSPDYLRAYDYNNVGYEHFIRNNTYYIYNYEGSGVIRYNTFPNNKENYDLSYGSLYNFDTNEYVYDETIFDEYQNHSGNSLVNKVEYDQLENQFKELIKEQEKNNVRIEDITITYIDPQSIQEYISHGDSETFFGFSVAELTKELGLGTTVAYDPTRGVYVNEYIDGSGESYNWKSFLTKVAIGTGVIIITATAVALSSKKGGTSFTCAAIAVSKVAAKFGLSSAITEFATSFVGNLGNGKDIKESLKHSTWDGLDSLSTGFMIGAVVGSAGVLTNKIKPSNCFVENTMVTVPMANGLVGHEAIQNLKVGDEVYSFDETNNRFSTNKIIDVFESKTSKLQHLTINGEEIITTENHPFYKPSVNGWVKASSLKTGDKVLGLNGEHLVVERNYLELLDKSVSVYNFTVENDHTYMVGNESIVVHNTCGKLSENQITYYRNKAGRTAKQQFYDDIVSGRDYHGLNRKDPEDLKMINWIIKNKKIPSNIEFAHMIDVQKARKWYEEGILEEQEFIDLISSPYNGILVRDKVHFAAIHKGDYKNESDLKVIFSLYPNARKQLIILKNKFNLPIEIPA